MVYLSSTIDQSRKMLGEACLNASKSKEVKKTNSLKREVNISTEKRSTWKIKIFSEYIDERSVSVNT